MAEQRQVLSSTQVAHQLGVSVRQVQRWARSGELPAIKMEGLTGAYVFDATQVELWRYRQSAKAAS
jgi:excisionase family DNA binding protein